MSSSSSWKMSRSGAQATVRRGAQNVVPPPVVVVAGLTGGSDVISARTYRRVPNGTVPAPITPTIEKDSQSRQSTVRTA